MPEEEIGAGVATVRLGAAASAAVASAAVAAAVAFDVEVLDVSIAERAWVVSVASATTAAENSASASCQHSPQYGFEQPADRQLQCVAVDVVFVPLSREGQGKAR